MARNEPIIRDLQDGALIRNIEEDARSERVAISNNVRSTLRSSAQRIPVHFGFVAILPPNGRQP
jgi:hypothetical protein